MGIASISDFEPQPLLIQSHLGSFAIATVGKINNFDRLLEEVFANGNTHFQEMTSGMVNATELVASLICKKASIAEGIRYVQEIVDGSMTLLIMTKEAVYAARDRLGRTPLVLGKKEDAYCVSFENFAYVNLGHPGGCAGYLQSGMCKKADFAGKPAETAEACDPDLLSCGK